jgi:lipoprotein NlpD
MRISIICLLLIVLTGCSSAPVNAPISSRGTTPAQQPTVSSPGGAVARPATPIYRPAPRNNNDYVVRRGDTLYSVAWQYGLMVTDLAGLNHLQAPYTIYPGQRLRVRGAIGAAAPVRAQPQPPRTKIVFAQQPVPKRTTKPSPQPVSKPVSKPVPKPSQKSVATYDGTWVWPTRGRVLRGFQPNAAGKKGIDIGGHPAQPVKAAASGKVVYSGSGLVGYGRLIIIKHNENLLSAYGHNSKLLVADGDQVKAGEMIAKMGNSGANRTALYFEIRKNGKPVNPMRYLPGN